MARPAKSVTAKTGNTTSEKERLKIEKKLASGNDKLVPPMYLSDAQMRIFEYITTEMNEASILGNLDVFILSQASIAIDRLQTAERQINEDSELLLVPQFRTARDMYAKEFLRCCNELCLSPQARAKISIAVANKTPENPLSKLMEDEDDDD